MQAGVDRVAGWRATWQPMRAHRLELAYDALDDGGLAARLISHMAKAGVNRVAGLHRFAGC